MASQFDVNMYGANIGALSNANATLIKVPAGGGGITVLGANVHSRAAATTSLYLVDMGTAGTAIAGTIAAFPGTVAAADPNEGTLVTAFVEGGHWIGVKEDNDGAANAVTVVSFSYLMGK
jgi:hypothetical protein